MLRKTILYLKLFALPILLSIIATASWFKFKDASTYRQGLLGIVLGLGITISTDRIFSALSEHKRLKRSLGVLKLTTIPYLKNLAENLDGNLERFNDICDVAHANAALDFYSSLDVIGSTYTNDWVQLMYSPDVVESIDTDDQFNKVYVAIYEQSLIKKALSWCAAGARSFKDRPPLDPPEIETAKTIQMARQMRDTLKRENDVFKNAINKLGEEVDRLLAARGAKYTENDRY